MAKKVLRLTEGDLHRIIKESVNKVLTEMEDFVYDVNDYRDLGTTSGLKNFDEIFKSYNDIKRILNYPKDDWELLHMEDWTKFFNRLRDKAEQMRFQTSYKGNANPEDYKRIETFVEEVRSIPYPDLYTSSNSGFGEKSNSVRNCLKQAYRVFGDFIDYFVSKHEDKDMKQQDINADWAKFDKTRQNFLDKSRM